MLYPGIFYNSVADANSSFHFSTAKWCHVDCHQVPEKYFAHMLNHLGRPMLDSVPDVSHCCQLIFKRSARRLSYKIFDEQTFKELLEEQDSLQFKSEALFRNHDEVPDVSDIEAEKALAIAKARARKPAARPTSRLVFNIGMGEGGCTREVELIWWPSLYSYSWYRKLTIRFFIRKTSL